MSHKRQFLATLALGVTLFGAVSLDARDASAKKVDPGSGPIIQNMAPSDGPVSKSKTVTIDGSVGGQFAVSKWLLTVPAGAYRGSGAITMTVTGTTDQVIDLAISPASLNAFLKPVTLQYKKTDANEDINTESIYWWNPSTLAWEPAPNMSGDPLNGVLKSGLLHFSTYSVRGGKAGW